MRGFEYVSMCVQREGAQVVQDKYDELVAAGLAVPKALYVHS